MVPVPSPHKARPYQDAAPTLVGVHRSVRLLALILLTLGIVGGMTPLVYGAEDGPVYLVEIKGDIDLGLAPYVRRVIGEAQEAGASAVVLEINTPGGRLDAALDIKNTLLDSQVPTIAFINREAFSAGALIAIAAHEIYMTSGAVVGAATPIIGGSGEKASEKVVSAVRTDFRATAEARGRDPDIAAAMVDEEVEVEGLVEKGKLLTLTVTEALEWGYSEGEVADLDALLALKGLDGRSLVATSPGLAEQLVRFFTNPVVASLLMSLGFLGLLFELQSPGFGVGGTLGAIFLGLFFWGHFLAGLAGWEGVVLVVVGVVLIGVEVFVIPGFGIAGLLGIAAFLGGLFISLVGRIPTGADYLEALYVVTGALVMMLVGGYLSLRYLPKRAMGGLVLQASLPGLRMARLRRVLDLREVDPETGEPGLSEAQSLKGTRGTALTDLRPSGVALINDRRVDVVTEGEFIPAETPIEVLTDEEYRRVVRAIPAEAAHQES